MPCAPCWGFGTALHEASHRLPTSPGGVLPSRPNPSARHAVGPWLFSEKIPRHENFFPTLENIFSTLDKKFSRQGKKISSVDVFLENIGGPPTPFLRCVRRMGVFGFCTGGAFPVLPIPPSKGTRQMRPRGCICLVRERGWGVGVSAPGISGFRRRRAACKCRRADGAWAASPRAGRRWAPRGTWAGR